MQRLRVYKMKMLVFLLLTSTSHVFAQQSTHWVGDVGAAIYKTPPITKATPQSNSLLPYAYVDNGQLYARVDTFGYKITPIGVGHFELATRLSFEGYQSDLAGGIQGRRPRPYGVGTFQETSYGAFVLYAFRDATSGGVLLDGSYAAEFVVGALYIYPQIGLERRDRKYVDSLYGVSPVEAQKHGLATYVADASSSPNVAIALEYPLVDDLKITFQLRKRWLDKSIYESPLVDVKQQKSAFLALSQTFH